MTYGFLGLLIVIADIYALIQIIGSRETGVAKLLWVLGVLVFPLLGVIVWAITGPRAVR